MNTEDVMSNDVYSMECICIQFGKKVGEGISRHFASCGVDLRPIRGNHRHQDCYQESPVGGCLNQKMCKSYLIETAASWMFQC